MKRGVISGLACFALFFLLACGSGYGAIMVFFAGVIVSPIVGIVIAKTEKPARSRWHAGATAAITCFVLLVIVGLAAGLGVVSLAAAGIVSPIVGCLIAAVH